VKDKESIRNRDMIEGRVAGMVLTTILDYGGLDYGGFEIKMRKIKCLHTPQYRG
jgi:hypothetical protein